MDKKFMSIKKLAIPALSLVLLLSQATQAFAMTPNELTAFMQQSPTVAVEVYEAEVPSQKIFASAVVQDFSDVKKTDWFYGHVMDARRAGLVEGTGNNMYKPHEDITYAQYLTIISKILDETVDSKPVSNPWYAKFIDSARGLGVLDKNENVNAVIAIPREMMIKYTCKALGIEPYTGNEIVFGDVKPEDAAWINAAYNEYLTEGSGRLPNGSKKFGFGEYATRAQLATMALKIKAYHENPTQYKEQAAKAREEADKKWEEQNEAKIDAAGVARAEEVFNEIPIYQKNTNIGLSFAGTGYTLTDASLFAANFLEVFLNYDGTNIESMNAWEKEVLEYVTTGSAGDIASRKQRIIDKKDKEKVKIFLSADRIEIKDGKFRVNAVFYDYVTKAAYKIYIGIGGHNVNKGDLAVDRWEFDTVE